MCRELFRLRGRATIPICRKPYFTFAAGDEQFLDIHKLNFRSGVNRDVYFTYDLSCGWATSEFHD